MLSNPSRVDVTGRDCRVATSSLAELRVTSRSREDALKPIQSRRDVTLPCSHLFYVMGPGQFLGAQCEDSCNPDLVHVFCDPETSRCECEHKYPVKLGPLKGCAKPVSLGDQCFYYKTCAYSDQNAECVQIRHNAICQCKQGYHEVTLSRPNKRVFCSQDILVVTTDKSTLLGVATGLAIFTALICFVLKLFVGAEPRHYANANMAPPLLFSSDTGIPMTVHSLRPGSRASSERSVGSYSQRGSRGVIVPASRAGAARAAAILLISCHLSPEQTQQATTARDGSLLTGSRVLSLASVHSASSARSFSARRYEREKEQRLAAQRARELASSPRSTEQLLSEQPHELCEWPSKSSDNTLDASEEATSEVDLSTFPPLSTSLPSYPQHSPEWPPKNS